MPNLSKTDLEQAVRAITGMRQVMLQQVFPKNIPPSMREEIERYICKRADELMVLADRFQEAANTL